MLMSHVIVNDRLFFYSALSILLLFIFIFLYAPKWYTESAVWLLHGCMMSYETMIIWVDHQVILLDGCVHIIKQATVIGCLKV